MKKTKRIKIAVGLFLALFICSFIIGGITALIQNFISGDNISYHYNEHIHTELINDREVNNLIKENTIISDNDLVDFIAYRIWYVRDYVSKYNGLVDAPPVSKEYARALANQIVYHSTVRPGRNLDPLLITAILETETNFVPCDSYDQGTSIGIHSMKRFTARELAGIKGEEYSFKGQMDPLQDGIRYAIFYMVLAQHRYSHIDLVIASYNIGFYGVDDMTVDQVQYSYTERVHSRWETYYEHLVDINDSNNIDRNFNLSRHH